MAIFLQVMTILAPYIGPILEHLLNRQQTRAAPMTDVEIKEMLYESLRQDLGK